MQEGGITVTSRRFSIGQKSYGVAGITAVSAKAWAITLIVVGAIWG